MFSGRGGAVAHQNLPVEHPGHHLQFQPGGAAPSPHRNLQAYAPQHQQHQQQPRQGPPVHQQNPQHIYASQPPPSAAQHTGGEFAPRQGFQQGYNSVEQAISQSLPPGSLPRPAPAPHQPNFLAQHRPPSSAPPPHQRQFSSPAQPSSSHPSSSNQQPRYEYGDNGMIVDREGRVLLPSGGAEASRPHHSQGGGIERGRQQQMRREEEGYEYDTRSHGPPPPPTAHPQQQQVHLQYAATLPPEPDHRLLFHSYILDYLQKNNYHRAALAFLRDVPDTPIQPLQPGQVHPASTASGKGKGRARSMDQEGAEGAGPSRRAGAEGELDLSSPNGASKMDDSPRDGPLSAGGANGGDSSTSTNSSTTHFGFNSNGGGGGSSAGFGDPDSSMFDPRSIPSAAVQIETQQGFLYEWWSVFWDVFRAKAGKGGTISARTFVEASQQAVDLGLRRNPGAAQIYQRAVRPGQPPSPPRVAPPYRGPGEPGYGPPPPQQRMATGPGGPPPPQGPPYRQATQHSQVLRAQEAAHAAAQQAQAMRANGTASAAGRQAVLTRRGAMSPAPLQNIPPGGGQGPQAQAHEQARQRQQYASQQDQVHRQQQAAAQAQLGVKMQQQQQQAQAAAAMAHAQAAQMANSRRTPAPHQQGQQALQSRPPSNQGSPYHQEGHPSSPAKRFQMVNGGPDMQQQSHSNAGSPYQNGVAYSSPSQQPDAYGNFRQGAPNGISQAQALSYALGDPVREQHARMNSNNLYGQSPNAGSPAYAQQPYSNVQTPHSSSRPPSSAPTPQQMDAAAALMEQQQQQNRQGPQDGNMAPPPPNANGSNGRPMVNRSQSQATLNGGGLGSAAGTPQAATPGADFASPGLQPPTPGKQNALSPGGASASKRKRESKDTREPKKRAVSTRERSNSAASPAPFPTPSPSTNNIPLAESNPLPSGLPDSFIQSPAAMFDPTTLDSHDPILLSMPNGDLSVGGSGFGGDDGGSGVMSQEQVDALFNSSMGGGSAVPDNGSFDFDSFFNSTGYGADPTSFNLDTETFDLTV